MNATAAMPDVFAETVRPLMTAAKQTGVPGGKVITDFFHAYEGIYGPEQLKEAAPSAGFIEILSREGGAVTAVEAAKLYGGSSPTSEEAVRKAARNGQVIAVKDGRGNLRFPVWQFNQDGKGGVLPGVRDVLESLRRHPAYDDVLPLSFFLNPRARLKGKKALEVLRSGDPDGIALVKRIAEESAE